MNLPAHKSITSTTDYRQFGINVLTGEACKLGMRQLCDLSVKGVRLVRDFFGMPDAQLAQNWNSTVGDAPAVASIMLSRPVLLDLIRFALHMEGYSHIFSGSGSILAMTGEEYQTYTSKGMVFGSDWSVYRGAPVTGSSRNTHQMTGRTE